MNKNWMLVIAATGALAISACTPSGVVKGDSLGGSTSTGSTAGGGCNITEAGWAVGKTADAETLAKIKSDSGATLGRVIAPDQAVTLDFRPDRVNVHVDAVRKIKQLTCG